ncbi:MAG: hypothetical protein K8F91_12835 [Candidatus Obscuribacterales bacterium]|nr:hypothetical protein [Candidatus Obscuribacterales bacterium]
MNLFSIDLSFGSAVRLGIAGRDDQSTTKTIPADQLFSWLSLGWIRLFGEDDYNKTFLGPLQNSPSKFVVSDGFPLVDGETLLRIPPWYMVTRSSFDDDPSIAHKELRTKWISIGSLHQALSSDKELASVLLSEPVDTELLSWVRTKRKGEKDNVPFYTGVVKPRFRQQPTSDEQGTLCYRHFVKIEDIDVSDRLESILEFMQDDGFGGNRSSGLGRIKSAALRTTGQNLKSLSQKGANSRFVLLSSCIPTERMLENVSKSAEGTNNYSIGKKSGWIYDSAGKATDVRKPSVSYFETGSLFSIRPDGKVQDVSHGGHRCFKYGVPFVLEG